MSIGTGTGSSPVNAETLRSSPVAVKGNVSAGENIMEFIGLDPGKYRLYIAVENICGLSNMLVINVPAYSPLEHGNQTDMATLSVIDISTGDNAVAAVGVIKNSINKVSAARAHLAALIAISSGK
jgi:hypothetical protein